MMRWFDRYTRETMRRDCHGHIVFRRRSRSYLTTSGRWALLTVLCGVAYVGYLGWYW